jgi:uncharacterized damage-inducible protein DinB
MKKTVPLDLLAEQTFDGAPWHGPNLRTALIGVGPTQAAWSPGPGRPSIWQIALHCAYWKHRVWQRVSGERVPFPRRGKDWRMDVPEPSAQAWERDRRLLHEVHSRLAAAVRELRQKDLEGPGLGQARTRMLNVVGVMLHDTYHAGQIRLLRKLHDARTKGAGDAIPRAAPSLSPEGTPSPP